MLILMNISPSIVRTDF